MVIKYKIYLENATSYYLSPLPTGNNEAKMNFLKLEDGITTFFID